MNMHRRQLGVDGEAAAAHWYERRGYRVRDRNWRSRDGELDLVLESTTQLVVCEVKTRSSARFGTGAEAVDWRKQRKIRLVATQYLHDHPTDLRRQVRFDVAVVVPGPHGFSVEVIEDAF